MKEREDKKEKERKKIMTSHLTKLKEEKKKKPKRIL